MIGFFRRLAETHQRQPARDRDGREELPDHLRVATSRAHDVAAHAVLALFERDDLREPPQSELRRRVRTRRRDTGDRVSRANVDDRTPAVPQRRQARLDTEKGAHRVDSAAPLEIRQVGAVDGTEVQDGGVVHEHVECAPSLAHLSGDDLPVGFARHVATNELDARAKFRRNGVAEVVQHVDDHHPCALLGEPADDRLARPPRSTGHDRNLVVQSPHVVPPPQHMTAKRIIVRSGHFLLVGSGSGLPRHPGVKVGREERRRRRRLQRCWWRSRS